MALARWNPTADMELFRRQMDRLFDEMTGDRSGAFDFQKWNPAIELNNAGENLMLKAQLLRLKYSKPQSKN